MFSIAMSALALPTFAFVICCSNRLKEISRHCSKWSRFLLGLEVQRPVRIPEYYSENKPVDATIMLLIKTATIIIQVVPMM